MTQNTARQFTTNELGIEPNIVRVGKDIIELVTSGMYIAPVTIYREYIQNALDSIDTARTGGLIAKNRRGRISIEIDHVSRSVKIRDNGSGIPSKKAVDILLAIGSSPKRGTSARGFRGVGRLSGLAYCRELEFKTKAATETHAISLIWNCAELRNRLADHSFSGDLRRAISDSVVARSEPSSDRSSHFFEVTMRDVSRLRADILLNEQAIKEYLAQVASVPFADEFSLSNEIEQKLADYFVRMPADITIGNESVQRTYRDSVELGPQHTLDISGIAFHEFANVDGEVGAIGWIGHHQYLRSIPIGLGIRGLRARISDLQVGESNLFDECYKETRFNGWSIGEIHIIDKRIVPNGRRDNFETNHHYYNLLAQIGPIASDIGRRCRTASVARNVSRWCDNLVSEIQTRLKRRRLSSSEVSNLRAALRNLQTRADKLADDKARKNILEKIKRFERALAKKRTHKRSAVVSLDVAMKLAAKVITNRDQVRQLVEAFTKVSS